MNQIFNKIRMPTLLGLTIITFGMVAGVYLTLQRETQTLTSRAAQSARDIKVTNLDDTSASISWVTDTPAVGHVEYFQEDGQSDKGFEDRDEDGQPTRILHHITLDGLTPATTYRYKVFSDSFPTLPDPDHFTTASQSGQNDFKSIVGSILEGDHFLASGLVFLEIPGATLQSTYITDLGNFILPLNKLRTTNQTDIFRDGQAKGTISVIGENGQRSSAEIIIGEAKSPIGPLKVGEKLDLTIPVASPSALAKFDLNNDGIINASDHSIVLTNFGRKPKVPRADLNEDGVVDRKDLDIISSEIAKLGNQ